MTDERSNNEEEDDPHWGRARTENAFQSIDSIFSPSVGQYFNTNNEIPCSPVASGASDSGLTPPFGTFSVLNPLPANHIILGNWAPITGLPSADFSAYSLQSHRDTHVAHGNITLDSYWDRQQDNIQPQYARPSVTATQVQGISRSLATRKRFEPSLADLVDSSGTYAQGEYSSLPRTPLSSISEGAFDRSLSSATNRPRHVPSLLPINVDIANGRVNSPQSPYSATSSDPGAALFSPSGEGIAWRDPFGGGGSSLRSPEVAASPLEKLDFTSESATRVENPLSDAVQTPQTPSRRRQLSRSNQEREPNKEDKDFILYLSLQGIRSEAVGLELSRISPHFGNTMATDAKGKLVGRVVVACMTNFSESKGTPEDAEKIVSDLMIRAEREGWSEGPLSRSKEYTHSLSRGKSIASDIKDRRYDARCRAAHKKWRINHPQSLPREDARRMGEKMAFLGMLLEGTAQEADGPSKEELKKNLLELWQNGTIAGKAVR